MKAMDFTHKVALVTGGRSGIGSAIAQGMLQRGAQVIITSRDKAPDWCKGYSLCRHVSVDFTKPDSLRSFFDYVQGLKRLDILVNNAGLHISETIDKIDPNHWQTIMNINVNVPMQLMQIASRKMILQHSGKILNVASIAALISRSGSAAYSASKSALVGLTRAVALDLASSGVLVNALCPGHTQMEMMDKVVSPDQQESLRALIPLGRFAKPDEIGSFALFLCSDLNTYISGQAVVVDGGVTIQ